MKAVNQLKGDLSQSSVVVCLLEHERMHSNLQVAVDEIKRKCLPRDILHEQSCEREKIESRGRGCLAAELVRLVR
jgi:hypothetical protein